MRSADTRLEVRNTTPADFGQIIQISSLVYVGAAPWTEAQLASHLEVFPEGRFVAVAPNSGEIVGSASSLIVLWDDYDMQTSWREFADYGTFRNHDPVNGRTLYGAEVMVRPSRQGTGIGKSLYRARRALTERLGLLRIRAGARLRGYHRFASELTAEQYVVRVVRGEIGDPTLSFQLRQGFDVLAVVKGYLRHDPESLGYAAVIEWINKSVARPEHYAGRDPQFQRNLSMAKRTAQG